MPKPPSKPRNPREIADLEEERSAARARYQGAGAVEPVPDEVTRRNRRRDERERASAKAHYFAPSKPR